MELDTRDLPHVAGGAGAEYRKLGDLQERYRSAAPHQMALAEFWASPKRNW
jgi:hypothetical protein